MEEEDENNQLNFKKRRLQNACDECRKRKSSWVEVKCDSANMPRNICSNCRAFNVECTHLYANAKKKRGPPKGTPRGKRTIQSTVTSILSTTKLYEIPEDQSAVREVLIDLANHIRSLEEELAELRREREQSVTRSSAQNSERSKQQLKSLPFYWSTGSSKVVGRQRSNSKLVEEMTFDLKYFDLEDDVSRHFGQSSSLVLIKNAMDIKKEYTGEQVPSNPDPALTIGTKRLEYWTIYPWQIPPPENEPPFDFPEDDLLRDLIDLYFLHVNQFILILHRPTFERSIAKGLHHEKRDFGAVVLAVCALGARHSNDPRVFKERSTLGHSIGWQWMSQIKLIKNSFMEPPTLYDVQLYGLYVLFMQATSTPESCWILIGLGIRFAQDVGAHRKRVDNQKLTVEGELWKRAFWMLYAMDVFASAFMGRPRAQSSEDFDTDLPIECDDEYWEHPDPDLAFKQPPGKPSTVSSWILLLKILEVIAMSQRTIYAVRRSTNFVDMNMSAAEWNQKAVAELDSRLNEWIESLPAHLKWDPKREDMNHFHQSVLLHVVYYWAQIQVHRPFVSPVGKGPVTTFPSLAICANAARSCCHVLEVQQSRGPPLLSNIVLTTLFNAAIFLTLNVWRGGHGRSWSDLNTAFSDVYKCMSMMRTYESRWQEAGRLHDIVRDLVSITHFRSSAKRNRDEHDALEVTDKTESVFVRKETRKIAGSNRVSAAAALDSSQASPDGSISTPTSQGAQASEPLFTLPVNSYELGSLPVHTSFNTSFNWFEDTTHVDLYTFGVASQYNHNHTMPTSAQGPADFTGFDSSSFQTSGRVGGDTGEGVVQDSLSTHSQRVLAQRLSAALGAGGHGFDSYFHEQTTTDSLAMNLGTDENSEWGDWGSYMADVDELIRAMNA